MARKTRVTQKVFAGSAANNGQFGSAQAGTKVTTTDLSVIQALPAWDAGWNSATISSLQLPPLEEMQGIQYLITTQLAYLFQEGIPEWDAGTTYYQYSIVKQVGTTKLYRSKTDGNINHLLSDTTNWKFLVDLENVESEVIWGGTAGGTANALTLTPTNAITAYSAPMIILFLPSANNTGAATLNVSGVGNINITKGYNGTIALAPNDLTTGKLAMAIYDGTQAQLINPPAFSHGADIAAAATLNLTNSTGDILNITGNTGITAVTIPEGRLKICKFSGTPQLTYGASLLLNTGGANYTCAANDVVIFYGLSGGVVVGSIIPASGGSPIPPAQTFTASGGDVTGTGLLTTNINLSIGANKVLTSMVNNAAITLAKIQNATANSRLIGSGSAGSGSAYSEISLNANMLMTSTSLRALMLNKIQLIASSGNFTTPANITTSTVFNFILIAGGAGGSGCASATSGAAGGAGETVYWMGVTGLSPSTNYSVTIGAAGNGGASGANAGTAGGNTSITIGSDTVTANGGSQASGFNGGIGGAGSHASPSVGTVYSWPGGGGGSGTAGNQTNGGSQGGASSLGGGSSAPYQGAGRSDGALGSGGSGGNSASAAGAFAGGNGKAGLLIATWNE